jgi:hypothetical protein
VKPKLELSGNDGNAFYLLAKARKVASKNNMDWKLIESEATSGNYDRLLQTLNKYFEIH